MSVFINRTGFPPLSLAKMGKTAAQRAKKKTEGGKKPWEPLGLGKDAPKPFQPKKAKKARGAVHPSRPDVKASAKSESDPSLKMGGDKLLL